MALYIGIREDEAIKKFQNPKTSIKDKNKIYDEIIYPAFKKLSDNLMYKLNQKLGDPYNDVRNECISHLTQVIPKCDFKILKKKGTTCFPWFNRVAMSFILQECVVKRKKFVPIVQVYRKDINENSMGADENLLGMESITIDNQFIDDSYKNICEDPVNDYFTYLKKELARIIVYNKDKKEVEFLQHIISILENKDSINEIMNKKELYIILRNLTKFNTREITKFVSKLKVYYEEIHNNFYNPKTIEDENDVDNISIFS